MRFLKWEKDGGVRSHVHGLYVVESKKLGSIVLLRFSNGTRNAFHSHAFNAFSWVLSGKLIEYVGSPDLPGVDDVTIYRPSFRGFVTRRDCFHQVQSVGTSWALTFRGPWVDTWKERQFTETGNLPVDITLTHGREVV